MTLCLLGERHIFTFELKRRYLNLNFEERQKSLNFNLLHRADVYRNPQTKN